MANTNTVRTADQANYDLNRRPENLRAAMLEMSVRLSARIQDGLRNANRAKSAEDRAAYLRGVEVNTRQRAELLERCAYIA